MQLRPLASSLVLFTFLLRSPSVAGHGRLTVPTTRGGAGYENDPVGFDTDAWVCRHATPNAAITPPSVTAGTDLSLTWDFSAAHVGDCAVFISYDVALPLAQQEYFKIANLPKCKDQNRTPVPIKMPSWLPGGAAILRWDWYGLHQGPNSPEFYSQCVDLNIAPTAAAVAIASIVKYQIIGIYPAPRSPGGPHYRNAFGDGRNLGDPGFFMTGPACADQGSPDNGCPLTIDNGNGGDIMGGAAPNPNPERPPVSDDGPPPCEPIPYTVVAGDTLVSIADKHPLQQVDWIQICNDNNLANCDVIEVGDELTIPCDANLQSARQGKGGDGGGSSAGLAIGIVIAILAVGALLAFVVYKTRKGNGPPPPPPGGPTLQAAEKV